MHKESHGFLYGILTALTSAAMAVFVKLAADIPNETIVFFRFATGLPFILLVASFRNTHFSMREVPKHLVRGIAGFMSVYFYVYAVALIPLVNAVTLSNTAPLFMPILVMIWLRQLVSKWRFVAAGIGFLGVVILLRPGAALLTWGSLFGVMTGLSSSIAVMGVRLLSKNESVEKILLYYFTLSTVLGLYPMIVTWKPISHWMDWGYLGVIGVLSTVFQYVLTKTYTHAPATKASMFNYLSVVFGGLAGWLIFGEVPDVLVWVGTALIIGGAILAFLDKTPPRPFKKA
ncbi:MAG: DMT family transporter [Simkania sp.]|nr:DMT family transporter [Simkania sp.]